MNDLVLTMKGFRRAMHPYVLTIYEIVLESKPDFVLEVGTGQCQSGRTIISALKENKKGILYTIDRADKSNKVDEEYKPFFRQVVGDSHSEETLKQVSDIKFDILHIDGDHSYEGVKKDFEMYVPLVKEGGLILMHDICNSNSGVPQFWKEIKYPKVALKYGWASNKMLVGFGIVEKV